MEATIQADLARQICNITKKKMKQKRDKTRVIFERKV